MADDINKKTQETAAKLFGKGIKMDPPYLMWRQFDKDLANDLSRHITGNLYSVIDALLLGLSVSALRQSTCPEPPEIRSVQPAVV